MRQLHRWLFGSATATVVTVSLGFGALIAPPDGDQLPGIAMGSAPIFRLEAAALMAIVGYVLVVAVVLAFNGRGFTKLGPTGAETGSMADEGQNAALHQLDAAQVETRAALAASFEDLDGRLTALEAFSRSYDKAFRYVKKEADELRATRAAGLADEATREGLR